MSKPRVLVIDIETLPGKSYFWSLFDSFIPIERVIEPGRIVCAAFKWYGYAPITFYSEWEDGTAAMLTGIHQALNEADAVVTFNGDKFDLPRLNGEFLEMGLPPVAPVTSIDLYKQVKKLGMHSNKLDYVVQYYKIGKKIETEGFKLWKAIDHGDERAQKRMTRYNKHDVHLTSGLYTLLRPYMTNHPHIQVDGECPNCGSDHVHSRGYYYTRTTKTQRIECQSCGAWSKGTRSKI